MCDVSGGLPTFLWPSSAFLTNLLYPEGEWPNAPSLIPYLAQSRALYIILVYHRSSDEADIAMSLMFVFGIVCLGLVVLAAERERIVLMLDDMVGDHTQEQAALDSLLKDGSDGDSLSVAHKEGIEAETGNRADARKAQVLDVAAEKARARKYAMYMLGMSGSANSVEEGNQLNDDDKKLVTVLFHMFHKYVDEAFSCQETAGI